jgi:hypothetical protein
MDAGEQATKTEVIAGATLTITKAAPDFVVS